MRAQTELPAVAIAFVLLTAVLILGIAGANDALTTAERPALEQQDAVGVSERLVSDQASITTRSNVLDRDALHELTADDLSVSYGLSEGSAVEVKLDSTTIVRDGDPAGGTSIDRLVIFENQTVRTLTPAFSRNHTATLPRRTDAATLQLTPRDGTTIRTVSANDRVLLRNESGLRGTFEVQLSRYVTKELQFEVAGRLDTGDVHIEYYPTQRTKASLTVSVDA